MTPAPRREPPPDDGPSPPPWWQRLLWFVALWVASVAFLGLVASLIRLALRP